MENNNLFTNAHILSWLQYFAQNSDIDLEHVKILDITRKNKNLIPTVEAHRTVLVFTEAGHPDIFYRMFHAGLGDCTVIYNEGSEPTGEIKQDKVYDMITRGINASAGMLILNPNARNTIKFGMRNRDFASGSVHYVGSEIRSILLSKDLPIPDVTMLVASASMEQEMECLLKLNPNMEFVIYTLDFKVAAGMIDLCKKFGMKDPDIIQVCVSKLNSKNAFETQPAPWIITGVAES